MPRTARQGGAAGAGIGIAAPDRSGTPPEPLVHLRRAGHVESIHRGHVAVVDGSGRLIAHAGDPGFLTFPRSSFKPFQALPFVESGAYAWSGLGADALALAAGSHGGTDAHAAIAASMVARAGAGTEHLLCGTHTPFDRATADALRTRGEAPGPLRHNCSGKHAAMLLLARFLGAPLEEYTSRSHPVQRRIVERFESLTGEPLPDAEPSVDGCSAPNPRLRLTTLARAFALLGQGRDASGAPAPGLAAIRDAMRSHPELVAAEGLLDTTLMRALPGSVTKIGAEAVHALAMPDLGWGIAIKVEDGSERALGPATVSVLEALGIVGPAERDRIGAFGGTVLRNHAGIEVGDIRGVARLVRESA